MGVLESALQDLKDDTLPGDLIFLLYDTYGFPTDLTNDIARERGYSLDMQGYEVCMTEQRARARSASQFEIDYSDTIRLQGSTEFTGYEQLTDSGKILGLYSEGNQIDEASEGMKVALVLDNTPFYAESGGQVGDSGYLRSEGMTIEIMDCQKSGNHSLHMGAVVKGEIKVGDQVSAEVDASVRQATALNHSATHLVHEALKRVLGEHVEQKGSLVDSEKLRFDFSHSESVSPDQIRQVEKIVNGEILRNTVVKTELMSMDEAKAQGASALFGEKYGDEVRVLSMGGDFSIELCGGTHVARTGDIAMLKITAETSVAAGIRRIEAVTGESAIAFCNSIQDTLSEIASITRASGHNLSQKVTQLVEENRSLQKQINSLKQKLANASGSDLMSQAKEIKGVTVLATVIEGADAKSLKSIADQVRSNIDKGVFFLVAKEADKASLVAGVTNNLTDRLKAGDLMKFINTQIGGKGGGRPDMAMGAATDLSSLTSALESVSTWVEKNLA
jgi:alanyl-tRNA synthetase